MLNLPASGPNPLNFEWLRDTQDAVATLRRKCDNGEPEFSSKSFDGIEMICFTEEGRDENDHWNIFLTEEAVRPAIAWFHEVLGHPGKHRLFDAMH